MGLKRCATDRTAMQAAQLWGSRPMGMRTCRGSQLVAIVSTVVLLGMLWAIPTTCQAQVLSDNPTYYAWAPSGATAVTVVNENEVGIDFRMNGRTDVYFRVENDIPLDGTTGDFVVINYRISLAVPWLRFGVKDENGNWHMQRISNVPAGRRSLKIPVSKMAIDTTAIQAYSVWVGGVGSSKRNRRTSGSFRFLIDPDRPSLIHIRQGDEAMFYDMLRTPSFGTRKAFHVHGDAVLDQSLDIIDRSGDEIVFLDGVELTSQVQAVGDWGDDRGVVNIVDCDNLKITGLAATNNFTYGTSVSGDNQSSTVLNISRSTDIAIENSQLQSRGKSAVWIHGNSKVNITNATIDAYYFCIGIGASQLSCSNMTTTQLNPAVTGDSHSVFWVSSAMRSQATNQLHQNSTISLADTTMNLRTGRSIVSGNGGYESRSNLFFFGQTQVNTTDYSAGKAIGWAGFHPNYHGFTITLADDYPAPTRDLAQPTDDGEFARFITNPYQGGGRPSLYAPIVVCEGVEACVSSDQVLGPAHPIDLVHGGLNEGWFPIRPTQLTTNSEGNIQAAYSASYEAVILNDLVRQIDMSQARRLRLRSKVQQQGTFTFRVSFVNEANRLLNPETFEVTGGDEWQTNTFALPDSVRQSADKIIIGSFGNSEDATLELSEITILAD